MKIYVLTLFPELFAGYLEHGLVKKACNLGLLDVSIINYRDFAGDAHKTVDDEPFGGGSGMVIKPEPAIKAFLSIPAEDRAKAYKVVPSARGKLFNQRCVNTLMEHDTLIFLAGRYKGFDQRIVELMNAEEISIGDYVVQGGEIPIMTILDATIRFIPGFLGDEDSAATDSFAAGSNLLSAPDFTRPREFMGKSVPEVLLEGNHAKIARWKREKALQSTMERRPDLIPRVELTEDDIKILDELKEAAHKKEK